MAGPQVPRNVMVTPQVSRETVPKQGQLVHVRSRRWLVESIEHGPPDTSPLVALACAEDDAQGETLQVYWDYETDGRILSEEGWQELASGGKGFDDPHRFGAFLDALRWNCVTATDPRLVQAPFRAGIKLEAYQIEPLRKALRLPLVNLFIADDTGLGKTIEAGLVARELLLRKKVDTIVVSAPPSVLGQWQAEFEERFGLRFVILDRLYLIRMRQQRGFGVNPWATNSFFLVSHRLLTDPTYTDPMRSWLGERRRNSLFILDEAHHAAPASGGRFGIESKFTRAIRDISGRFEHRLFLSATPHNGHSRSFAALLELLDPHRFTQGVKVRKTALKEVMVRRLKEDIRQMQGGFPVRKVCPIELDGLGEDAPELVLSRLLDEYRSVREKRFKESTSRARATAALLAIGLQQRLLSSVEAFARSLAIHTKTALRHRRKELGKLARTGANDLIAGTAGADDERSTLAESEIDSEEDRQVEAATALSEDGTSGSASDEALWQREVTLRERMRRVAEEARGQPDEKIRWLLQWMRKHLCPGIGVPGERAAAGSAWTERRVLIFTENRQSTKRYLREMMSQAIAGTDRADERIEVIDGLVSTTRRREIQRRFNTHPSKDPLRILLATDAAREGLNFQAHCADLFHYDLPWNPGRIEQRNGRIDRKLQPEAVVRCHYFVLPQRTEDRVLEVLVDKTKTIRRQLGSLSKVIEDSIEDRLNKDGIRHADATKLAEELKHKGSLPAGQAAADDELDAARARDLEAEVDRCRRMLERSRRHVEFSSGRLRNALSCALAMLDAEPLKACEGPGGKPAWKVPPLDRRATTDSSWALTMDSLRAPRKKGEKFTDWRKTAAIRPVVFKDPEVLSNEVVHVHLEQRLAQRLLARFRSQGFVYHDLSRACLVQSQDSLPRVLLLARLLLFGRRAERLHEELIPVAARWRDPKLRKGGLVAYARDAQAKTLSLLDSALEESEAKLPRPRVRQRLLSSVSQDIGELLPQLEEVADAAAVLAERKLAARGKEERAKLEATLREQKKRVETTLGKEEARVRQLRLFRRQEVREIESRNKAWRRRIQEFGEEIKTAPKRVQDLYRVSTRRVEPVGIVYLWPDTN
ncbi:MAG: DISARM system SNF2-like helicase DrmD [Bryobacterales bacterium]|nr:DISARM system SNF2-like helicase DrmD [Bryobacterales bacterium]